MTMIEKAQVTVKKERREELIEELVARSRRFHSLPGDLPAEEAAHVRRSALEEIGGSSLHHTGSFTLDAERASRRNCENFIGAAQVPVGIIGPLRLRGQHVDGDVYVPMATTEAALVASTNRGCAAIREAGGATVRVEEAGMTRAPAFRTSGIEETQRFLAWVREHEDDIRAITDATSRYLTLLDIRPSAIGTSVFLRFRFDCGDAMGMNMATIACDKVVTEYIEPQTGIACIALSGNYCVDKKPAQINFHEGRGKRVFAEVEIDGSVLKRYLKTTARDLVEAQYRKNLMGSIAAGSLGHNAHIANVLSAVFIATGQDPAHVVEGSMGVTCIEPRGPEGVFASIYLPDLPVGAIGGGTDLATQREALGLLGVHPNPEQPGAAARRLAEIVGGAVLAGELSLMAAFTSNDLARAHERLGRGKLPPGTAPSV
jgi:hydroxymethylglutaryl-CoA reductase (NADPH)